MRLLGHRGARHDAPENTLLGIRHALENGMSGIEIDIHRSSDGELMVIHDFTLERTTNGIGEVSTKTKSELKSLDAGKGETIPTLREVINLTYEKALLFIEIKGDGCEVELVKLLAEFNSKWFVLKSFNHRFLKNINQLNKSLKLATLFVGLPVDPVSIVKSCGAEAISIPLDYLDKELVELCHHNGIEVCSWNCNDRAELLKIEKTGVDWVGTDCPSKMSKR